MKQLNFQLLVDGTDLTDYVVSVERNHSFCNPISSLDLVLAPNLPVAVKPYQDVLFYEDGTKTFTGYSQEEIAARLPVEVSMSCNDVLIRAQDTWFTGPLVADGESAIAWIKKFLHKAGIRKISAGVSENYAIYPGYGWEFSTCLDAIVGCMQQCPYRVFADGNGIVHIDQARRGTPEHTINEYASYNRVTNDCWIRNRAVVYGNGFVADKQTANPHLLPGEVRAAIVATGQIHQMSTADAIASRMLNEFSEPLDIKVIELEGSPDYEINQIVDFTDPETGYHRNDCLITGINTIMNAEDGYVTEITLDEKCVSFWGWDTPTPITTRIYTAMTDSGVYRSAWDYLQPNCNWVTYNEGLAGSSLTVYDLKISNSNVLWIATDGGLYKRHISDAAWQRVVLPEPEEDFGEPEVTSICRSKLCMREFFVLTQKEKDGVHYVWLYRAIQNGLGWEWVALEAPCLGIARDGYIESLTLGGKFNYKKFAISYSDLYTFNDTLSAFIHGERNDITQTWNSSVGHSLINVYSIIAGNGSPYKLWMCGWGATTPATGTTLQAWDGAVWHTIENARNLMFDLVLRANGEVCVTDFGDNSVRRYDSAGNYLGHYLVPDQFSPAYTVRGIYERNGTLFISYLNTGAPNPEVFRHLGGDNWADEGAGSRGALTFAEQDGNFFFFYRDLYDNLAIRDDSTQTWSADAHAVPNIGGFNQHITCLYEYGGVIYVGTDKGRVYRRDSTKGYGLVGAASCDDTENNLIHIYGLVHHKGDWIASVWYDRFGANKYRIYRIPGPSIEIYISDEGRTHLLDMDEDGYVYANVITVREDRPLVIRVYRTLIDAEDEPLTRRAYGPVPLGTWSGVLCEWGRTWVFGDLDLKRIIITENNAETWTDKTYGTWGANELVRSLVPTFSAATDYVAILNVAEEAWATQTDGELWSKAADLTFPPNFGRDLLDGMGIFIGDEGPDADILRHSIQKGKNWTEQSTGIPIGKRMANVVEEIDYI